MKWLNTPDLANSAKAAPPVAAPAVPLEAILNSMAAAVLALDAHGRRLYANAAAERLFELVWQPSRGGLPPTRVPELHRQPGLMRRIEAVILDQQPRTERVEMSNGRQLDVYLTPLPVPEGGCVIVARDVTDVVRLEATRKDFIAGISHELRTPLMSIQGYAEILREQPDLPEASRGEFLDCILQSTGKLSRLARDLVALSTMETGNYPFHFTRFEAAALIDPALAMLAPLAGARGCELVVERRGPGSIRADAEAIQRVLVNLIENAIVHGAGPARERGQPLRVAVSGETQDEKYLFRVCDNGPGIGSADQHRIFERFYRVRRGPDETGGTGLGLALVKHIVMEHGGRISLQSALGHGSTFTVTLPLAAPPADPQRVAV